jgi:hypothetical protein
MRISSGPNSRPVEGAVNLSKASAKRRFWQIHLSTAIVVIFVAGGLLGLNLHHILRSPFHPRPGANLYYHSGWPFSTFYQEYNSPLRPNYFHPTYWWKAAYNAFFTLFTICITAAIMEFWSRRRYHNRVFSIRSLLLFVSVAASALWLWENSCPWSAKLSMPGGLWGQSLSHSETGEQVFTIIEKDTHIWNASSGAEVAVLHDSGYPTGLSLDNRQMVTSRIFHKDACVWDLPSGTQVAKLPQHPSFVVDAKFSPNGKQILTFTGLDETGADIRIARLWSMPEETSMVLPGQVDWAVFSPDGARLIAGTFEDATCHVLNTETGKELFCLRGHLSDKFRSDISAIYSPDGDRIITSGGDGTVRVWDAKSGTQLMVLHSEIDSFSSIRFSPDQRRLIVSSFSRSRVWDADAWKFLYDLPGTVGATEARYSPDSKRILIVDLDGSATIWDAETGKAFFGLVSPIRQYGQYIYRAEFLPGGETILAATSDGFVQEWSRRRPEAWWGIACIPEFWLFIGLLCNTMWSVWRDLRKHWTSRSTGPIRN